MLADRFNPRPVLMAATAGMVLFGLLFAPLLASGSDSGVVLCLALGLGLMGLGYGPLGAALAALFPTAVRYTGASLAFNLAGILGASLTPYAATWLATQHGLAAVGFIFPVPPALRCSHCCCCRATRCPGVSPCEVCP